MANDNAVWDDIEGGEETVWHYADVNGLIGMVRDHEIWASHISYMNDLREGAGLELAESLMKATNLHTTDMPRLRRSRWESDRPDRMQYHVGSTFSVSASQHHDSLAMWRGYGGGKATYDVGIDRSFKLRVLSPPEGQHDHSSAVMGLRWQEVQCDHRKTVSSKIKSDIEAMRDSFIPEMTALEDNQLFTLSRALLLLKDPSSKEEAELRLGCLNVHADLWNSRSGPYGLTSLIKLTGPGSLDTHIGMDSLPDDYIEKWRDSSAAVDWLRVADEGTPLPISGIMCPPGATENDAISARRLLAQAGYVDPGDYERHNPENPEVVPVGRSKIPFRW